MHLQTLAITINQLLIGKVRLLLAMLHHIPRPFGLGIFCCHSPAHVEEEQQTENFTLIGGVLSLAGVVYSAQFNKSGFGGANHVE